MITIVGLSGSLRRASLNTALLRAAAELMPDGAELGVLETKPWFGGRLQVSRAHQSFDASGNLTDEAVRKRLRNFLAGFVKFIHAERGDSPSPAAT